MDHKIQLIFNNFFKITIAQSTETEIEIKDK